LQRAARAGNSSIQLRAALRIAISELQTSNIPSATLAAELLMMHVLGRERGYIYSHPEARLPPETAKRYFDFVRERASGKPTQYITGHQEFWGLDFEVTKAILIPRPETEHLVEAVIEAVGGQIAGRDLSNTSTRFSRTRVRIVDVGTGSGCIALALASEIPEAEIIATDISREALLVARQNAVRLGLDDHVHFVEMDLLAAFADDNRSLQFDFVVSNPPYVGADETDSVQREVREFEPPIAWGGKGSGIEIYRSLIPQALAALRPGGWLAVEVGYTQADRVRAMLGDEWTDGAVRPDLMGIPRVVMARKASVKHR
jgi:release factor glutamine methyltransferase